MKTERQQAAAAAAFAQRWKGRGYEKGDSQVFWTELLTEVFGVENPSTIIRYEEQVKVDNTNFIDGHIPSTKVLIEQKSIDKDLRKGIKQSDGSLLNPFQQAKRYAAELPYSERPRWIVTCNFAEFLVYDMEQPNGEPQQILLENLGKEYYRLQFLVDAKSDHLSKEMEVSIEAGKSVGRIYDALWTQYDDSSPEALRWLNILCVRIVFCLYAEDAGIFSRDQFHDFLVIYEAKDLRRALRDLFEVLNTPKEKRSKYLQEELAAFPYTNGGLFEEEIEIPQFTEELKQTLLQNARLDFDWSDISPTIFGAVFESTLNPETRRSGGMHYTSIENIHKVIDPLFLNELRRELDEILEEKVEKQRLKKLDAYQDKLGSLTFLDPACGSGNFLTETYLSLRRLENEAIRERYHGQTMLGAFVNPIKVSIQQFYGIEINDFAVTVATTALWISEAQMLNETERIIHQDLDFLPLKSYANIREGNALRVDWAEVVPRDRLSYIIGNPPFVGARLMDDSQKKDVMDIFPDTKNVGNLDYVACWYRKAVEFMANAPSVRTALVSTNSITQGEQVAILWKPLMEKYGVRIDFAWRTFRWDSESNQKAHVHCVIVGTSGGISGGTCVPARTNDKCMRGDAHTPIEHTPDAHTPDAHTPAASPFFDKTADVNESYYHYLPHWHQDGKLQFVTFRLADSLPKDKLDKLVVQKESFLSSHPRPWDEATSMLYYKQFGSKIDEWLDAGYGNCCLRFPMVAQIVVDALRYNDGKKYVLHAFSVMPNHVHILIEPLANITLSEIMQTLKSYTAHAINKTLGTTGELWQAESFDRMIRSEEHYRNVIEYIKKNRSDFMDASVGGSCGDTCVGDTCVPARTNNKCMREDSCVCMREDAHTPDAHTPIERTAQAILDARALYPDCSLADLYDPTLMPAELRKAHRDNDRAVMAAYGLDPKMSEQEIVAHLFAMYETLAKK